MRGRRPVPGGSFRRWSARHVGNVRRQARRVFSELRPELGLALCTPPGWTVDERSRQHGIATPIYPKRHDAGLMLVRRALPESIDRNLVDRIASGEVASVMHAPIEASGSIAGALSVPETWQRSWHTVRSRETIIQTHVEPDGELFEGFFIYPSGRADPALAASAASLVKFP